MLRKAKKQREKNIYLAGVVDGEGSFEISVEPHNTAKFGWVIDPKFTVALHKSAEHVLRALQQALTCGRVIAKSGQSNMVMYIEQSRRNLYEKIIPFFERYPLEIKAFSYHHFKTVVSMLVEKQHHTPEGFLQVAVYAISYTDLKGNRKYTIQDIIATMKHCPPNAEAIVQEEINKLKKMDFFTKSKSVTI